MAGFVDLLLVFREFGLAAARDPVALAAEVFARDVDCFAAAILMNLPILFIGDIHSYRNMLRKSKQNSTLRD
tara:strand:- start:10730 stop:10945 length:216 start_codon:yes stop_codon:yes gene_type:complete